VAHIVSLSQRNQHRRKGVKFYEKKFRQLRLVLDYAHDHITNEDLYEEISRRYDDFEKLLPRTELDNIKTFFKEMLSYSFQSIVRDNIGDVLKTLSQYRKNSTIADLDKLLHPHYWALKGGIFRASKGVEEILSSQNNVLVELLPKLQIVSYDKLAEEKRNKQGFITDLTKVWVRTMDMIKIIIPFGP